MKTCDSGTYCVCSEEEAETCPFRCQEPAQWVPLSATFRPLDWLILATILTACLVCLAVGFDWGRS